MLHHIDICIYGSTIRVRSKDQGTLAVLESEFRHFLKPQSETPGFLLTLHLTAAPEGLLPLLTASRISQNSLSYDEGPRRWNDYFGQALTVYDYQTRQGSLYSADADLLHELTYLMVLSLTGKDLDTRGWHKIHACAFRYKGRDAIVMLPSKGGKTTLFLALSQMPGVSLLSDDTPLIDQHGQVHPFALRLGVEQLPAHLAHKTGQFHLFKRQRFSDKWLIPLDELGAPMAQGAGASPVLYVGQRWSGQEPSIHPLGPWDTLRALGEHMIVGIGLPMVLEYFLHNTPRDWLRLAGISLRRLRSALRLMQRSSSYRFVLGRDSGGNARELLRHLDQL